MKLKMNECYVIEFGNSYKRANDIVYTNHWEAEADRDKLDPYYRVVALSDVLSPPGE